MSAVLKPYSDRRPLPRRSPRGRSNAQLSLAQESQRGRMPARQLTELRVPDRQAVRTLPTRSTPAWLQLLIATQRSSTVITFLLVVAALVVYGWTVCSRQLWSQEYRRLETLHRHERQLIAANETLKDQIAQQAENPATGLMLPSPGHTIFLQAAPQRHFSVTEPNPPALEPQATPLGY